MIVAPQGVSRACEDEDSILSPVYRPMVGENMSKTAW